MKKKFNIALSLIIGAAIFGFFLYHEGAGSVFSIFKNVQPIYLGLYFLLSTLTFIPTVMRWKIILNAHGAKAPFLSLLRYTIAGYAVSYITPSARVGGELLKAYMIYKEQGVDLKTASSSLILEKFVELSGSVVFGFLGVLIFLSLPGLPFWIKAIISLSLIFASLLLIVFYYRSVTGRGSFSSAFMFLRLNKIKRWSGFVRVLSDVEARMKRFFIEKKKAFLLSFFTFFIYAILVVLEFRFLLIGLGFNEPLGVVILAIVIAGFAGFVPIPASLGFLEASQSALFAAVRGLGSLGFAMSLVIRVRQLFFTALGFSFISYFSSGQVSKKVILRLNGKSKKDK